MNKPTAHRVGLCQCRFAIRHDSPVPGGYLFCAEPMLPDRAYCAYYDRIAHAVQKGRPENMHRRLAA